MDNPLRTPSDYELYMYSLPDRHPSIRQSTVTLVRLGASLGRVAGEMHFARGFKAIVRERLVWERLPARIEWYGYEVWRGNEKLFWYDPQPHPADPDLQDSYPHHKHVPPDMKHHRVPATTMSFNQPNLSALIEEIETLIAAGDEQPAP